MDRQHSEGPPDSLDSFTRGFVRKCARQLIGKFGFRHQDREDIEQCLYLKLGKRLRTADPEDPKWKAFVAITTRRHIVSMVRDREAEKRDYRETCSVHVRTGASEKTIDLAATLVWDEIPSHRSQLHRPEQELVEIALDVNQCIADVADNRQREFLERLKTDSISQIARDMDIPRTTLNSWLLKLRQQFEKRALKEYL